MNTLEPVPPPMKTGRRAIRIESRQHTAARAAQATRTWRGAPAGLAQGEAVATA